MAYVFESKFFGEKPMKRVLDAANDNPSHITPGSGGDHVSQIQAALFAIDSAAIDADELGKSFYGPFTAKAVAAFKTKRKILNYLNQIDDIVGIKTMQALDQEMKRIDGGLGKKAVIKTQDIVVHILGQNPTFAAAGKKTVDGQSFIGVPPTALFNKEGPDRGDCGVHQLDRGRSWTGKARPRDSDGHEQRRPQRRNGCRPDQGTEAVHLRRGH
jgi:peptidoglycan hydrolase-like protein with peptidoglycan-binding domain